MDAILRAFLIYAILLVLFRMLGKRSLGEVTTFDFVLLLIIGEATQQALLGDDFSVTNAAVVIATLVGMDMALGLWQQRSRMVDRAIEGLPLVLLDNGTVLYDRLEHVQVNVDEIRQAAREIHGLERLEQVKYAVLEKSGNISIIPREHS